MATSKWVHGVNGDFDTASNWTDGVPGIGDIAEITVGGTYTVTSSQVNTIGTLDLAKKATLDITDDFFGVSHTGALAGTIDVTNLTALGLGISLAPDTTTFKNTGTINLQSGNNAGDNAKLNISGDVTLTGNGKINMSGADAEITQQIAAALNNDSTIVGDGVIGAPHDSSLTFVNEAKGVVDGNTPGGLLVDTDETPVTNSGLMEATSGSGFLILTNDITQMGNGKIKSATSGATVLLESANITGGQYATVKGGILWATEGTSADNEISNPKPIDNAGIIKAEGGNLLITGSVDNTSTGALEAGGADGAGMVTVEGAVKGGQADLVGASELVLEGSTSARVIVAAGSTGTINLFDPAGFTGTVAGMSQAPDASLDLENIEWDDDPTVNFNPTTHLLTVTDPVEHVTDTIKIVGTGTFSKSEAFDGSTLISDPPGGAGNAHNAQLLAQSIAAFGVLSSSTPAHHHDTTADVASREGLTTNSLQDHG